MSEALRLADALNKAAPFADDHINHDAAALLRTQAARIAELEAERFSRDVDPAFAPLASNLAEKLALVEAERDQLRAEVERLRVGLLETARMVEDLKKPVSMDNPESPQAARNSLYMSISYFARAIESAKEQQ